MLSRKELREKLGTLEELGEISDVNLNAKTTELQSILDNYLGQKAEPAEPSLSIDCPVCGGDLTLDDGWWSCSACGHKHYDY